MRALALAACATLVATGAAAAPETWMEVRSPHFLVVTNSGDKAGRRAAWQFEQIRAGLSTIWPWAKIGAARPFVVFAVKDEATLRTLGPQYWEGKRYRPVSFSANGRDRSFLAIRTDLREPDDVGANPYQAAYWSYSSLVFTNAFPRRLPEWYGRGVAEVMSNTLVREREIHVGRLLQHNLEVLRQRAPIPLDQFLAADRRSPWVTQEDGVRLFDAHAWALVHYLMFGEEGRHAARVDRFNRLLLEGAAEEPALKAAFGDMAPYHAGMRAYVTRRAFGYARIPVSLDLRAEGFTAGPLAPADAAVARAEFLVAIGRPAEARALAAEAAKADAARPGPWEIEATLLDAENRGDEARAAYAKAAEAGSKRAYVYYRLAQLEWSPSADRALLEKLAGRLETARRLDPSDAFALSFLAEVRSSLGRPEEALDLAVEAVRADPAAAYHRLALARILWSQRRPSDAQQMAESALEAVGSDAERQQVREFLDFVARSRP